MSFAVFALDFGDYLCRTNSKLSSLADDIALKSEPQTHEQQPQLLAVGFDVISHLLLYVEPKQICSMRLVSSIFRTAVDTQAVEVGMRSILVEKALDLNTLAGNSFKPPKSLGATAIHLPKLYLAKSS